MSKSGWIILALASLTGACSTTHTVWYGHSPDRRHLAEVIQKKGVHQLRLDDEPSGRYSGIAVESMAFSDDSDYLAFAAESEDGWIVIKKPLRRGAVAHKRDVQPRTWSGIAEIRFSPTGRLAYVAEDSGRWHVVVDGEAGPAYDAVMEGSLTFSPDGRRHAFVIADGDHFRVVTDGSAGPAYEAVGALRFGPDGERLAYVVRRNGEQFLVVDGQLIGPYPAIADFTLGPSGRLGFLVRAETGWHAVIDGDQSPAFESIGEIEFSDGGRYAYAARRDSSWYVVRDGDQSPPYEYVDQIAFVGETAAYVIRKSELMYVVANGKPVPAFAEIGRLVVVGQELAYLGVSLDGVRHVIHRGATHAVPGAVGGTLVLSEDGLHWACLSTEGNQATVVIDGLHRRPFDVGEMLTRIALGPKSSGEEHEQTLRRWVSAELEDFLRNE